MSIITEAVVVDSLFIPREQRDALSFARWCEVLPRHLCLEEDWVCIRQSEKLPKPWHLGALTLNQIFAAHCEIIPSLGNCPKLLPWSTVPIRNVFAYYLVWISCLLGDRESYGWNSPGLPLAAKCAWAGHGSNMDALGLERAHSPLALPDLRTVLHSARPSCHPGPAGNSKHCKPLCHLHVRPARLEVWSSTSFTVIQQQAALDGYAYKRGLPSFSKIRLAHWDHRQK